MFVVNGFCQDGYVVIEDKQVPNLVDRSIIDLADRVLAVAVVVVTSLGVLLAVAIRDYEGAFVLGVFGVMAFLSACGVSKPEGYPRVIKGYRVYLGPPPVSFLERRPYIEWPEFRMKPYYPENRPLDRAVHASVGKEQLDENRHVPVGSGRNIK